MFDGKTVKIWINSEQKSLCIYSDFFVYNTFNEILDFLNIKRSRRTLFLCDSPIFEFIKDQLTHNQLKHLKLPMCGQEHNIENFTSAKHTYVMLSRICQTSLVSLFLKIEEKFVKENKLNILMMHLPECIYKHGLMQLKLTCYLNDIKSSSEKIYNKIVDATEQLADLQR